MAGALLPYQNPNNTFPQPVTFYDSATFSGTIATVGGSVISGGSVVSGGETVTGGSITDTLAASSTVSAGGLITGTGLKSTSSVIFPIREVTASGTITVTAADYTIAVNKTVGAATAVSLEATPITGIVHVIKDEKGDAGANNITITPAAGNIDNAGTLVISTNKGSARLQYTGAQWISI